MNSKKIVKIATILMIIATVLMVSNMVMAVSIPSASGGATSGIAGPVTKIMGIVQYICYAAAVILLIILGVRFMVASPDGKAEIKKSAVIYVVGAFLVFAAGAILGILSGTFGQVTG